MSEYYRMEDEGFKFIVTCEDGTFALCIASIEYSMFMTTFDQIKSRMRGMVADANYGRQQRLKQQVNAQHHYDDEETTG